MRAHQTSLRRRLTGVCLLLTIGALLVTGLDSYWRERDSLEHAMRQNLATLVRMVAVNVQSGLEFGDRKEVQSFLDTVASTMSLQAAAVFIDDHERFVFAGDPTLAPTGHTQGERVDDDWLAASSIEFTDLAGATHQGHVVVRAAGAPLDQRLNRFLSGLGWTMAMALCGLGLAAHWLLTNLLRPIATLVETTQRVRSTEDYALRARATADDEVGALVRSFNAMLDVIQERDTRVARSAEKLEQQVRERTAELRRALNAAEAATRAKSTFVANMSHEIRTPLNAVLGMAELAMDTDNPTELREYLEVIRSAGSTLLGILCDILDLSKIESGKLELSPVPTDLEALTLEALRPLTSRIQSKDLELVLDVDPSLRHSYLCDDVRLRQILTNLVGNAIKFTERGFVLVRLSQLGEQDGLHQLRIVVQDSGVGIPSDRLAAIFTPFTQADNTITRRFAGTGLGLSITDRLVRLMGGNIEVHSTLGVGTTFAVKIPLEPVPAALPAVPPPPPGWRLLLVARSEPARQACATIAQRLGMGFASYADLAQLAAAGPPGPHDALLIDDRDPDHDAAICATVGKGAQGLRPVFLLTAYQDLAGTTARCQDRGYAGYLTKPIAHREVAQRLHTLHGQDTTGPERRPADPRPAPAVGAVRPLRILVAEDNPVNQKLIERILQRDGHTVTMADNGRICVDLFTHQTFDLVLMDMQMPEMSGLEAAATIRRDERRSGAHIPIVALTANTSIEDREACLLAGMDQVLAKPVSIPRLRNLLAQLGKDLPPTAGQANTDHDSPS